MQQVRRYRLPSETRCCTSAAVRLRVAGRSGRPGCRASRIGSNAPSAMDEALAIIAVGSYVLLDTATDTQFG